MKKILKRIYKTLPFKKQFFIFLKFFFTPPKKIYRHLSFKGDFNVAVREKKFIMTHHGYEIENEIFWKGLQGGWESECVKWWIQLCLNAEVILDIGANTGIYALIAQTVHQKAKVYAFEPVPKVFEKLQHNISLNNFEIRSYAVAISDYDGIGTIALPDVEMIYSVTVNQPSAPDEKNYKILPVETLRLSTFIKEQSLKKVDLMKIDVETHEGEVLHGMEHYLEQFRPVILIEILNDVVGSKVENLLHGLGYNYYHIKSDGNLEIVNNLTGHTKYYNYLLKPNDSESEPSISNA